VDDPCAPPDFLGNLCVECCFSQSALEGGAEEFGEGFHRQEEVFAGRQPFLPIARHPAAGDQVVDVGMVEQVAGPGVEHTYHANLPTHKAGISGQLLGSLGGSAEKQVVDQLLVVASELAQL
jgi:hypothetical protein